MNARLRLFVALVSIAIAAACILESAREGAPAKRTMRVAEPH